MRPSVAVFDKNDANNIDEMCLSDEGDQRGFSVSFTNTSPAGIASSQEPIFPLTSYYSP